MFYAFKARNGVRKDRTSVKKQYQKRNNESPQAKVSVIEIWLDKQPLKQQITIDNKSIQNKISNSMFKTFFKNNSEANKLRYQQKRCKTNMSDINVTTQTKTEDILLRKQLQSFNHRKSCQIQKTLRLQRENSNKMSFTDFRHCFKKQLPNKNTQSVSIIDDKLFSATFCRPVTYSFKTELSPSSRVSSKLHNRSSSIFQSQKKRKKNKLWEISAWSTQFQLQKDMQSSLPN